MSAPSQWRNVAELAKAIVGSKDLVFAQTQANLILQTALKEIERSAPVDTSLLPISKWEDASHEIPRNAPAADIIMERVKTIDGTRVFVKGDGNWYANSRKNKAARVGYKLASGFHAENGGQVMWRTVAMFALAVDEDRATEMTQGEINLITGGFEEGSAQAKKQDALKEKYPNLSKAILSFF